VDKKWLIFGGVLVNKNFQIKYLVRLLLVAIEQQQLLCTIDKYKILIRKL